MAYASGGRASFCDKGAYDGTVTYHRLDYVKYQGAIFVCKATSLGNAPNLTVDTAYWTKFIDSSGSDDCRAALFQDSPTDRPPDQRAQSRRS